MRSPLLALALVTVAAIVGAATAGTAFHPAAATQPVPALDQVLHPGKTAMTFSGVIVSPAAGIVQDMYEPTITVSGTGAIYVAGHVVGADSTGTPAYVSTNNGVTWRQLPAISTVSTAPVPGSALPGGDEGVIVADGSGRAWLVDSEAGTGMSVTGYCGDGASVCYTLPTAWSAVDSVRSSCGVASVGTDRPWAAYANNKILLVNNGYLGTSGGNRVQLSVLNVPPGATPPVLPPTWNGCASGSGFIPGVPALRGSDGRFVVPQVQGSSLKLVTGLTSSIMATTTSPAAFSVVSTDLACPGNGYGANWGFSTVSQAGTFYATAAKDATHFTVAATTTGTSFKSTTFATVSGSIAFLWISGSQLTEGALVSWAEDNGSCQNPSFYAGHITLDASGNPSLSDVTLVAASQTGACGDLMGSSLSPSGKAYVVVFVNSDACTDFPLATPLRVYKQTGGPTL